MEKIRAHLQTYQEAPDPRLIDVLDGVRALCVMLVGWYHIWQQGWLSPSFTLFGQNISLDFLVRSGYIWVDGLMLLSAFLLFLPFALQKNAPGILSFYKRRLIRIIPSYLLCVIPLFILAMIQHKYPTPWAGVRDLMAHLTFTHTLFPFSYLSTPLNGALWTLGVEMQFYFLFPFLARAYRRFPLITWLAMTGAAFAFRGFSATQPDTRMLVNQLPAFLDVYANGFLAASIFATLRKKMGSGKWDPGVKLLFTALFILCVCQLMAIARGQAGESSHDNMRIGQMNRRFTLSVTFACAMICAACSLPGLRFLLGNAVMRFLASISLQFYIWHQLLAVQLKGWGFPPSLSPTPWAAGEYRWQLIFTLCCFGFSILLAALITYLFEQPVARRLRRIMKA